MCVCMYVWHVEWVWYVWCKVCMDVVWVGEVCEVSGWVSDVFQMAL